MTVLTTFAIAAGAILAISSLVGLAVAKVLGCVACELTELLEEELWASAPLKR